ncbi:hypothetical protein OG604_50390 [Streptomyces sp. NBC_01231]|nr:hypothetical protein OG604_50390 [Streptomyces sp. NBC_01231]
MSWSVITLMKSSWSVMALRRLRPRPVICSHENSKNADFRDGLSERGIDYVVAIRSQRVGGQLERLRPVRRQCERPPDTGCP